MKLGVLSDTHKHIANLIKAISLLKRMKVDLIIHLGDDYSDVDDIGEEDILRVPGVFSNFYQDPNIPNRRIKNFGGWRFLITHTIFSHENDLSGDIKPEEVIQNKKIDVVLYGHTHVPDIKKENDIIFFNPGHLKNEDKRGFPPTFGYLEINGDELIVRVCELTDGAIFKEKKFEK